MNKKLHIIFLLVSFIVLQRHIIQAAQPQDNPFLEFKNEKIKNFFKQQTYSGKYIEKYITIKAIQNMYGEQYADICTASLITTNNTTIKINDIANYAYAINDTIFIYFHRDMATRRWMYIYNSSNQQELEIQLPCTFNNIGYIFNKAKTIMCIYGTDWCRKESLSCSSHNNFQFYDINSGKSIQKVSFDNCNEPPINTAEWSFSENYILYEIITKQKKVYDLYTFKKKGDCQIYRDKNSILDETTNIFCSNYDDIVYIFKENGSFQIIDCATKETLYDKQEARFVIPSDITDHINYLRTTYFNKNEQYLIIPYDKFSEIIDVKKRKTVKRIALENEKDQLTWKNVNDKEIIIKHTKDNSLNSLHDEIMFTVPKGINNIIAASIFFSLFIALIYLYSQR